MAKGELTDEQIADAFSSAIGKEEKKIIQEPEGSMFMPGEIGSYEWLTKKPPKWTKAQVLDLQRKLNKAGYDVVESGEYDGRTAQAHRNFLAERKPGTPQWLSKVRDWDEDKILDLREFLGFPRELTPGEKEPYSSLIQTAHSEYFQEKEFMGEPTARSNLAQRRKEMKFGLGQETLKLQEELRGGIYSLISSTTGVEPTYENVQFYFGKYASDLMFTMEEQFAMKSGLVKQKMQHFPGITEAMSPEQYQDHRSRANEIYQKYEGRAATDEEVSMLIRGQVPPTPGFNIGGPPQ